MKNKNIIKLFVLSTVVLLLNSNTLSNATLSPIIYTETNSFNYLRDAGPITWYVIDDDPKEYWITLNNNDTEEYLVSPQKFSNSKIIFTPLGLSTGSYNISLYVSDYSGYITSSLVEFTIIRETYTLTNTDTGTATETKIATPGFTLVVLAFIFVTLGLIMLKNRYKMRK